MLLTPNWAVALDAEWWQGGSASSARTTCGSTERAWWSKIPRGQPFLRSCATAGDMPTRLQEWGFMEGLYGQHHHGSHSLQGRIRNELWRLGLSAIHRLIIASKLIWSTCKFICVILIGILQEKAICALLSGACGLCTYFRLIYIAAVSCHYHK